MLNINAKDACRNDGTLHCQQTIAEVADTTLPDMADPSRQLTRWFDHCITCCRTGKQRLGGLVSEDWQVNTGKQLKLVTFSADMQWFCMSMV